MKRYLKINNCDNVVVALTDLMKDEAILVDGRSIMLKQEIKRGHKAAIAGIKENENIVKYGFPIGHSTRDILP
jgi:altronate hydrolase